MIAAIQDAVNSKISNVLIILGYFISFLYHFSISRFDGLYIWGSGMFVPVMILFLLFYFKMLGAGDIKLLSVSGSFTGMQGAIRIIVLSFFIAAIFSVIKVMNHKNAKERFIYFWEYIRKLQVEKKRIPYIDYSDKNSKHMIHFSISILFAVFIFYWL